MKVKDIIKELITTDNYSTIRINISDEFINLVKNMMPHDYEYFREKEEAYQEKIKLLNNHK